MKEFMKKRLDLLRENLPSSKLLSKVEEAASVIKKTFDAHRKLLCCGNGGSAADAQHIAAEFVVRYKKDRMALPAVSLTVDTSVLTACANDFGYERVFERQIESIGEKGDTLLAISTSGNSRNVNLAVKKAKEMGMSVIYMTGKATPPVSKDCDIVLNVETSYTPVVQEIHRFYGHLIVELVEKMEGF